MDILGEPWTIKYVPQGHEGLGDDSYGITHYYDKVIYIDESISGNTHDNVLRHEIIHAYHVESGMVAYAYENSMEQWVDWFAHMYPRISITFNTLGIGGY